MPPRGLTRREISNIERVKRRVKKKLDAYERRTKKRGDLLLQSAANDTADMAKHMGNYTDRTGNLRNSIHTNTGLLKTDFDALPEQNDGRKIMPDDMRPRKSIEVKGDVRLSVVGVGMSYGKHVQNREGYDVIAGAAAWAKERFAKYFKVGLKRHK